MQLTNFDFAGGVEQHVVALDVSVDNATIMQMAESSARLLHISDIFSCDLLRD